MNYTKGLDEFGIMFFFPSRERFFSSKSYSEFVSNIWTRKKNIWTKFLGQFGRTRPVDAHWRSDLPIGTEISEFINTA